MSGYLDTELRQIIAEGASDRVEFKETLSDPTSIRSAICAFANDLSNHKMPGLLFVGVRDDKTIGNSPITDQLLRTLSDMKYDGHIVPPPAMTVEKRNLGGKEVAVVTVLPSASPPVRCSGIIEIRTGPRRAIATAQDERILNEKRRSGDSPFDVHPLPTAGVSDLNLGQFRDEYLPQAVSDEILALNERRQEEQLASLKMIASVDQPWATVLGMLTLGIHPQDFLPGAYIQFLRIDGDSLADDIVDSEEIRGAIPDLLRRLDDKLRAHNRIAIDIASGDVERRSVLFPVDALQQIARNAVMHRTYEGTHAPVRITWFNDRIEICSPGGPFGAVTAENFGTPGVTDYRNPNLAEAMKTLGYVQRYGVGIAMARRKLENAGLPPPEFDPTPTFVMATIQRFPRAGTVP